MSRVFFTSDLHLGHKNLVEGIRKMSVTTSDRLIIENWNKVVTKRDIVYILGDVTMEKKKDLEKLKQLNGKIYIVGGNHDVRKVCKQLQNLGIVVMGCVEYKGFVCTHYPIHPTQLYKTRGNIHGHLHITNKIKEEDLGGRYYNVNTEFHNYTPVLFDDIVKYFEGKEQKPLREYKILVQSRLYENEWYIINPEYKGEISLTNSNGEECKGISIDRVNCDLDILKREYNVEIPVIFVNRYLINQLGLSAAKKAFMRKEDYNNCSDFKE